MSKTIENTLENKAKFFALYWGSEFTGSDHYGEYMPDTWSEFPKYVDKQYLILKPLSSISDEDAKKLAVFCGYHDGNNIVGYRILSGLSLLGYFPSGLPIATAIKGHYEAIDFLRSLGYALPWMNLSVQKLILYGWIKLKED